MSGMREELAPWPKAFHDTGVVEAKLQGVKE